MNLLSDFIDALFCDRERFIARTIGRVAWLKLVILAKITGLIWAKISRAMKEVIVRQAPHCRPHARAEIQLGSS